MADYRSTLTGTQMDAALLDMAEHNSEAYAVGERNGIAVASDDVTYHNNARYYAQIASSQIVGDASSAVRWDTDQSEVLTDAQKAQARENINAASDSDVVKITAQTLTSAQQAQARANIMAGGSNRNLLDNPFFTVNQRGFTSVTDGNGAPLVDRWKAYRATVVLNTDNSMTVTPTSAQYGISQFIEASRLKVGQTYTMSALVNGEILSASFVYNTTPVSFYFATFSNGIRFYRHYANGVVDFWVIRSTTEAFVVQAVKLERGAYSTLANDAPPEASIASIPCHENFLRLKGAYAPVGYAIAVSTTLALVVIPTPVPMRAVPKASLSGALYFNAGTPFAVTGLASNGTTLGVNQITQQVTGTFEVGKVYLAQFRDATSYIDLSADL